jgi:RimJ/RimL family protein N-acetyltransferase
MLKNTVPPFLVGDRIVLRPLDPEHDLENIWRWINDPEVRQFIKRPLPATRAEEHEWLSRKSDTDIILGIELKRTPQLIGSIGLHRINWIHRRATSGTLIGKKELWGQGYGTEAKQLLLRYAFLTLNLHRVGTSVFATNPRSLACQKKCGYIEEGRLRSADYQDGQWVDSILLGVLKDEWRKRFDIR